MTPAPSMKVTHIVKELETVAAQLGRNVRYERGSFRGGHCTVEGKDVILLNKRHTPEIHLSVLAHALRDLPLEGVFMRPATRSALEDAWAAGEIESDGTDEE